MCASCAHPVCVCGGVGLAEDEVCVADVFRETVLRIKDDVAENKQQHSRVPRAFTDL